MDELRAQAHTHGAMVVSHLGNHEYMNALGSPALSPSPFSTEIVG